MESVTIISHLTPEEWKMSRNDKVVEDTREHMRESYNIVRFPHFFVTNINGILCFCLL